jgi:hypothetical protein
MYRWQKESKTAKAVKPVKTKKMEGVRSYLIHDNGGRPYRVEVGSRHVQVYDNASSTIVYETPVQEVWVGDNLLGLASYVSKGKGKGNTLLLQIAPHRYTYIGHVIYSFDTGNDIILKYYSPIGNGDVPYPYAVGEKYVYFVLDKKRIAVEKLDLTKDGYTQFYREVSVGDKKAFRVQLIHTPSQA